METDDPSECDDDSSDDNENNDAGCCAGITERFNKRCNERDNAGACNRRSSCHWIVTDDVSDCNVEREEVAVESDVELQGYLAMEFTLFGADISSPAIDRVSDALNGQVSLFWVMILLVAVYAMYRAYGSWNLMRNHACYKVAEG